MVSKPGRYGAKLLAWTVEESKSGQPVFVVRFQTLAFFDGEKFLPEPNEITGYFYPVKKDGQPNATAVEMLMKVLGWDGRSLLTLHEGQHEGRKCQIEVKEEEYLGNTKLKVGWIYPADYAGSVFKRQESSVVKKLDLRWSKALGGSPSAAAPAPAPAEDDLSIEEENIPF